MKYGEPPYGHAELSSLKTFSKRMGIDLKEGMSNLKNAEYRAENEMQTLAEIGRMNNISPQQVYLAMKPEAPKSSLHSGQAQKLPDSAPAGTGNLTLAEVCQNNSIPIDQALNNLSIKGIKAKPEDKLRKIASDNGTTPLDLVELIRQTKE